MAKKKSTELATTKKAPPRGAANSRRRSANKRMTQAVLRERLRQSNNLTMIIKRLDRLEELRSKVARKGVKTQAEQAALIEERMLIKTDLDSRFRLLGKYLPDLRSIDLADQDGNSMVTMVAQAWAEALQDGGGD